MPEVTLDLLVDGGKASAGAQMGTTLGPLKINIGDVVNAINEKTKDFAGMQVPVKVTVNTETKEFKVKVGTPPASQLILKEINAKKGSGNPKEEKIGNLMMEQVAKIAKNKSDSMFSYNTKNAAKEIVGTCTSMGVTIEGMSTKEAINKINEGKYDEVLA